MGQQSVALLFPERVANVRCDLQPLIVIVFGFNREADLAGLIKTHGPGIPGPDLARVGADQLHQLECPVKLYQPGRCLHVSQVIVVVGD